MTTRREELSDARRRIRRGMIQYDSLPPDGRELVRKWGRSAMDRLLLLHMTPAEAERDLRQRYGEPVRT